MANIIRSGYKKRKQMEKLQARRVELTKLKPSQPYILSEKGKNLISHAQDRADSKGNLKLSDNAVTEMIKMGAIMKKDDIKKMEEANITQGGFNNAT